MKKKFIILGYGNPDRGDDGVALHILQELIKEYRGSSEAASEFNEVGLLAISSEIDIWFNLQLIPEVSQDIARYEHALFIDAHTAEIPEELFISAVEPVYQNSPFTHHLTPGSCLALAERLYNSTPKAILITVRGYSFDFSNELSQKTAELARKALSEIRKILGKSQNA